MKGYQIFIGEWYYYTEYNLYPQLMDTRGKRYSLQVSELDWHSQKQQTIDIDYILW